jgi:hypothetical protein
MVGQMSNVNEARLRLQETWRKFISAYSAKFETKVLHGATPPSIFVGEYGYPKVALGPMVPPILGNTSIFDSPELWSGLSFEQVVTYRINLIRGITRQRVDHLSGRFMDQLREIAMSESPIDSVMTLQKEPKHEFQLNRLDNDSLSWLASPLDKLEISSGATDKRLEKIYEDTSLLASNAIIQLYISGVPISKISRALSIGLLGTSKKRKLVPSKWSISATDNVLSNYLKRKIVEYPQIDHYEVYLFEHLHNLYSVILIPDSFLNFEMIEAWIAENDRHSLQSDSESRDRINSSPKIAGAYFAGKLAVEEHLYSRKRSSSSIIIREVGPEYVIPLGVWQVREGVRATLKQICLKFDNLKSAVLYATSRTSLPKNEWISKSKILRNLSMQSRISDFMEN